MNLDWSIVWRSRFLLLDGAEMTVLLAMLTMAVAVPGGILLALMRLSPYRALRWVSATFVEAMRNLPLILVVYWAFYVLPELAGLQCSAFTTGLVALSLNVSAYNSETFRAGIASIRVGQTQAAMAMGLRPWQVMWYVILPQSIRRVLPVLASTWISLFKDTSLVSVIGVSELAHVSLEIRSQSFRVLEMLTAMAGVYWLLGYPQAKLVDWIYRRFGSAES